MSFPVDQTVTNNGQVNNEGDSRALFLKVFSGEVLTAFHQTNHALALTRVRSIRSGKSAQFPVLGTTLATYHTPGQLIKADQLPSVERTVTIDDVALSAIFVADIDDAISHFDVRSQYSAEAGQTLADMIDRNIFRMVSQASFITDKDSATAAGLSVPSRGQKYTANIELAAAGDEDDGSKVVNAIFKARTQFRKASITGELVCVLPPEQYEALVNVQDTNKVTWMNKDVGGVGSAAMGTVPYVAGVRIIESVNVPQDDETVALLNDPEPLADGTVGSGNAAKYRGDYSRVIGLIFQKDCVATTKLMDVSTKWVNEDLRLGSTVLTTQAVGHDILRFECAVSILKAAV
jgi:hypothetical protein